MGHLVAFADHPENPGGLPRRGAGATILGKSMKPFTYPGLGIGKGATEQCGVQLTGWLAWISRFSFFRWFMPDPVNPVRVVMDWLMPPPAGRRAIPLFRAPPESRSAASAHPRAVGAGE